MSSSQETTASGSGRSTLQGGGSGGSAHFAARQRRKTSSTAQRPESSSTVGSFASATLSPPRQATGLPPVPTRIDSSPAQTQASLRDPARSFEEVLSSGHTLVISPGPRESFLPSDSDSVDDDEDPLAIMEPPEEMAMSRRSEAEMNTDTDVRTPRISDYNNGFRDSNVLTQSYDTVVENASTQRPRLESPTLLPIVPPRSSARPSQSKKSQRTASVSTNESARFATPPSGNASPSSPTGSLPVHPLQRIGNTAFQDPSGRSDAGNSSAPLAALHSQSLTASSQRHAEPSPSPLVLSASTSSASAASATTTDACQRAMNGNTKVQGSNAVAREGTDYAKADKHPAMSSAAVPTLKAQTSLDTSQIDVPRRPLDPPSPKTAPTGAFRNRFKKTGTFFKRLGGGGGEEFPVANDSTSATSSASTQSKGVGQMPTSRDVEGSNSDALAAPSGGDVNGKDNTVSALTKMSLSHKSTHKGALPFTANQSTSSSASSQTSGSMDFKHKMSAWERDIDDALQDNDLASKTRIEAPKMHWSPTPQLPEDKTIARKGSFMDEEDKPGSGFASRGSVNEGPRSFSTQSASSGGREHQTPRSVSVTPTLNVPSSDYPSLHKTAQSSSAFGKPPVRSLDEPNHTLHSRNDNISAISARSYETAMDMPSHFLRRQNMSTSSEEPVQKPVIAQSSTRTFSPAEEVPTSQLQPQEAEMAVHETESESEDEQDPERSIRLVTHQPNTSEDDGARDLKPEPEPSDDDLGSVVQTTIESPHRKGLSEATANATETYDTTRSDVYVSEQSNEANAALSRDLASKCWNEDVTFKKREKIAEWIGGSDPLKMLVRHAYFEKFDFKILGVEAALRKLCDKLFLRAETQQVDRILAAFSQRYFVCNSDTMFGNADVIHAVSFSILLLNTDLHVAELDSRMTRTQFVRNTLDAIVESDHLPEEARITDPNQAALLPALRSSEDAEVERLPVSKAWANKVEVALKDIYSGIRAERIRLPLPEVRPPPSALATSRRGLKAGSGRVNALKRGSIRGIQGLIGTNAALGSGASWDEVGRTSSSTPAERDEDGTVREHRSPTSPQDKKSLSPPAFGFTSTLAQSIIRENTDEADDASVSSTADDLTDEELALLGPPWAKEGNLTRKHYYEGPQKRAKDKAWVDCFVVVQSGLLSMFRFGDSQSSGAAAKKQASFAIGGGNWLSNATCIGQISLSHTLANALPPPGYNRARPHVLALTLPTGAVYFFQTGHEELVQEWVLTCNYWAARLSREPLAAGVSNMEYGWSRVQAVLAMQGDPASNDGSIHTSNQSIIENLSSDVDGLTSSPPSSVAHGDPYAPSAPKTSSDARSIRSTRSMRSTRLRAAVTGSLFHSRPPASNNNSSDRIISSPGGSSSSGVSSPVPSFVSLSNTVTTPGNSSWTIERPHFVNEWRAPAPPTTTSTLNEEEQLEACIRHASRIESELTLHNSLRQPMLAMYHGGPGAHDAYYHGTASSPSAGPTRYPFSTKGPATSLPSLLPPSQAGRSRVTSNTSMYSTASHGGASSSGNSRGAGNTSVLASKALANWERKSAYLLSELTKFQVYVESLKHASHLRAERRDQRELSRMIRQADEEYHTLGISGKDGSAAGRSESEEDRMNAPTPMPPAPAAASVATNE